MKNLITRTVTGIVFVVVIVLSVCIHPFLFAGVFAVITGLMLHEFYSLTGFQNRLWCKMLGILAGMYLFVAMLLYAGNYAGRMIFLPYILIIAGLFISELYLKNENPVKQWGLLFLSQVYCAGSLSFLAFIPFIGCRQYTPLLLMMIFVFIWLNDTGAYLIGSLIGKRRLFVRISPKKSWEGFFGGFAVVLIASLVSAYYFPALTRLEWLLFAVVTVVAATFGDLIESLFKRTCNAKDSSRLLPGHGGVLDRFDSAILASPAVYVFLEIITRN